jgi:hypothetical protein
MFQESCIYITRTISFKKTSQISFNQLHLLVYLLRQIYTKSDEANLWDFLLLVAVSYKSDSSSGKCYVSILKILNSFDSNYEHVKPTV